VPILLTDQIGFCMDGEYDFYVLGISVRQKYSCGWLTIYWWCCRTDGAPSLGWEATTAFLVLPVFLVISQYVSMQLMQPKTTDPQAQQANAVLKVLPLMIGWFSLNVPSALCIYWVANNIITTATTLAIRNSMPPPVIAAGTTATMESPRSSAFAPSPLREKPQGFAAASFDGGDGIKPITPIDAEIVREDDDDSEENSGMGSDSKVRSCVDKA
jgi:YidC/Oxa1 family membrane protein insertase